MLQLFETVCSHCIATTLFVVVVLILAVLHIFDSRVYDAKGKRIPGPDSNLWGRNVLSVARKGRQMKQISKAIYEEFLPLGDGNIVSYVYFGNYSVLIGHPDMVKVVLSGHHTKFPKPLRYNRIRFVLGDGLVLSKGLKWQSHRHAINGAFHAEALKGMVPLFSFHINKHVERFHEACKATRSTEVNFGKLITDMTMTVICQAAFGFDLAASGVFEVTSAHFDALSNEMNSRLADPTEWWQNLYSQRVKTSKESTEYFQKLIGTIISDRVKIKNSATATVNTATTTTNTAAPSDLLDILLTASDSMNATDGKFTEQDLYDHVMTFLFAGHETTASALTWVMYELCLNPLVQERCQAEVDEVGLTSDTVSYDDISKYPYISQVMKETIRLHPTAGMIGRVTTDGCTLGEYEIKPNTTIMISTFCVHRHPDFWEQPDSFVPERFAPENMKKTIKNPFQYIPFSAGPRNCIGQRFSQMEMVVILVRLLNEFTFSFTEEAKKKVYFEEMLTSHPSNMFVTVTPRK